jgi:hypothetical protein
MSNIKEYEIPSILFIKGVFIRDCIPIDELFEQQLMEQLNNDNPVICYEKFPSFFVNNKTWIKTTNIKCWYCDLSFDSKPVFIPKMIEHSGITNDYNIPTLGCFCSFCCAKSYCDIYYTRICDHIKINDMLKFLYNIFNGKKIKEINSAPNKYEMVQYGGSLDPLEFRKKIVQLSE